MDCDTTGIEPDIALIKYKKLVGEGFLKIVNQTVPAALQQLGLHADEVDDHPRLHRRARDHRGRPGPAARASAGLRLRLQAGQRRAVHPLHGPRPDDGRDPAVPLGGHQQDRQHARGRHGRGHRGGLPPGLEARPQGHRDLPRRLEALPAALTGKKTRGSRLPDAVTAARGFRPSRSRTGAAFPTSVGPITHKFQIAGHEGYITVGLYPDGQPGEFSSRWRRRARPSAVSWTRWRR